MKKLSKRPYLVARRNVSGLIRIALADLEACEADPLYEIDMDVWHVPNSHCAICLAGSVMAKTLNVPRTWKFHQGTLEPFFSDLVARQLMALDFFRIGWHESGWEVLELPEDDLPLGASEGVLIPCIYEDNPEKFKQDMNDLADLFEAAGY